MLAHDCRDLCRSGPLCMGPGTLRGSILELAILSGLSPFCCAYSPALPDTPFPSYQCLATLLSGVNKCSDSTETQFPQRP